MVHIELPEIAEVLSVANQNERSWSVWALVRSQTDSVGRAKTFGEQSFLLAETGQEVNIPVDSRFLGTVLFSNGSYVLHVWEVM